MSNREAPKDFKKLLQQFKEDTSPAQWTAWTDGSGHTDGYGGYGAVVMRSAAAGIPPKVLHASGALCGTTVNRAEFTGLLEAMELVHTHELLLRSAGLSSYPVIPTTLRWFSDRENLVLGVATDPATNKSYYGRKTDADLWARYEYYAKTIKVMPVHTERNTLSFQAMCDHVASHGRRAYIKWLRMKKRRGKWL